MESFAVLIESDFLRSLIFGSLMIAIFYAVAFIFDKEIFRIIKGLRGH